jgi:hypothetical protein
MQVVRVNVALEFCNSFGQTWTLRSVNAEFLTSRPCRLMRYVESVLVEPQ